MFDPHALLRALPLREIQSHALAEIDLGLHPREPSYIGTDLELLEPPCGGPREPYVEPVRTVERLGIRSGLSIHAARVLARAIAESLLATLPLLERPVLVTDLYPSLDEMRRHVPVSRLVGALRSERNLDARLVELLDRTGRAVANARILDGWAVGQGESIRMQPALPQPGQMIEFFVGLPMFLDSGEEVIPAPRNGSGPAMRFPLIDAWRNEIRPVTEVLTSRLGKAVYHFALPEHWDSDDDDCHRWLALHCWCTLAPTSSFARFLVEASGAADVEALKAHLVDPASYIHPFELCDRFAAPEPLPVRLAFEDPVRRRRMAVLFESDSVTERALSVAATAIDHDVMLITRARVPVERLAEVERTAASCEVRSPSGGPFSLLAEFDDIIVLALGDHREARRGLTEFQHDLAWIVQAEGFRGALGIYTEVSNWPNTDRGPPGAIAIERRRRNRVEDVSTIMVTTNGPAGPAVFGPDRELLGPDDIELPLPIFRRLERARRAHRLHAPAPPAGCSECATEAASIARELREYLFPSAQVLLDGVHVHAMRNAGDAPYGVARMIDWELLPRTSLSALLDRPAAISHRLTRRPGVFSAKVAALRQLERAGDVFRPFDCARPECAEAHGREGVALVRGSELVAQVFVARGGEV